MYVIFRSIHTEGFGGRGNSFRWDYDETHSFLKHEQEEELGKVIKDYKNIICCSWQSPT